MAERSRSDFELGEFLGDGSFCYVCLCTERASGKRFAQKIVNLKTQGAAESCKMEAHCLRRLAGSPYIPALHCIFESSLEWSAVLDFYEGGELWTMVRQTGCLDPAAQVWYVAQMAEAVGAVHAAGIVHRDLKCENFLIDSQTSKRIRLIDFGTARDTEHPEVLPLGHGKAQHHVGSPNFMSPEAIDNKGNDFSSDIWSLGCCIAQFLVGAPPFTGPGPFFILDRALRADLWLPESGIEPKARELVNALVRKEPDARLGADSGQHGIQAAVLEHPFFAGRPSTAPAVRAECDALCSIGRAIWIALGPVEEVQGPGFMQEPGDQVDEVAQRQAAAESAWKQAFKEIETIVVGCSPADAPTVRALRHMAELLAPVLDVGDVTTLTVEGISDFSHSQVSRFLEQAKRLRNDIENPVMPGDDDDENEEEEEEDEDENQAKTSKDEAEDEGPPAHQLQPLSQLETENLAAEPAGQHDAVTIEGEGGEKKKKACCVCI